MHTIYARINNVSAFLSSCLMVLLAAIALSSFIFTADPKGELTVASVQVFVPALYSIAIDLTSVISLFLPHTASQVTRDGTRTNSKSLLSSTLTSPPVPLSAWLTLA